MRTRAGFTLLEVLVALTIASIAIAAGFGALTVVSERSRYAEASTVAVLEGRTARERLVGWLEGAQNGSLGGNLGFQGLDAAEHGLVSDELLFPTTASTPLRVWITQVRLYIDVDLMTPEQGLVAELTDVATVDGAIPALPKRVELVPQAVGFDIRYLSEVEGIDEWLTSWVGRNGMPRAIELTILAPLDSLPPLLQLPIRVAFGVRG